MEQLFNNNDLNFDIEKIQSFNPPITVSTEYENSFEYPFAIDVEDTSYWYINETDRNDDFEKLKSMFPKFSYI